MTRILPLILASVLTTAAAAEAPAKPVPGEGIAGEWAGTLDAGVAKLRLALHISANADGELEGSMDSLDQGANGLPLADITLEGRDAAFQVPPVGGAFKGTMREDGSAMEGTWSQGPANLPLVLERREKPLTLNRPQEPKPPLPYRAEDVTFENKQAKIKLAGTFLTPEGDGPFPAVLFVSGSGAQDRDEALMGHRPFLVIADYLARRGIASLRYDDRGFAKSEGNHMESTVTDFASDAEAGIEFLTGQAAVEKGAIGIVGHSEGGLSGPRAATRSDKIAFLVLLAPPGVPLTDLLGRQARDGMARHGFAPDLIDRVLEDQAEDYELLKDESAGDDEIRKRLRERAEALSKKFNEEELAKLDFTEARLEQQLGLVTTGWFRSLVREDPAEHLKKLKIPVLALFGEKDVQVAADENAKAARAALESAGNPDHTVKTLPGLNHLFQHSETGAMEEYGEIEETISPEVLDLIGDWILKRFGPARKAE